MIYQDTLSVLVPAIVKVCPAVKVQDPIKVIRKDVYDVTVTLGFLYPIQDVSLKIH